MDGCATTLLIRTSLVAGNGGGHNSAYIMSREIVTFCFRTSLHDGLALGIPTLARYGGFPFRTACCDLQYHLIFSTQPNASIQQQVAMKPDQSQKLAQDQINHLHIKTQVATTCFQNCDSLSLLIARQEKYVPNLSFAPAINSSCILHLATARFLL